LIEDHSEDTASVQAIAPEGTKEETILVVEDDDEVRTYSVDILRELGYRVIEAHDGPSALRLLERQARVDLLFTDVVLPSGLTGAEVAAEVRKLRPEIRVLFTTGYARKAIVHHGRLDAGVNLIPKPFTYAQFAAKVREVLDSPT
jgi:CheY-like chemotaxis protein